ARVIADSEYFTLFEEYADKISPTVAARVIHLTPADLRKDGVDTGILNENHFRLTLNLILKGKIAKEGAEEVLKILCQNPDTTEEEIIRVIGIGGDVDSFIERLVEEKKDFIAEKGEHAFKPLMGLVMKEFRGKVDGKIIAEKLKKAIRELT
ncbi:MAG TPA: Glu-tRNA(Gln) amidotransferase GatDE subunit E, partial [Archaeoglobaceae archaeon]|nr:Glu-tRNA(Gln) amidotransferase GatDE subunit E [Archaeoglobaceae archaeon]